MNSKIISRAEILWNYFQTFNVEGETDIIIVCCSYDLRVCDYACDLYRRSGARVIVFSGESGNWTRGMWNKTEAEIFRDRAVELGIDPENIILESKATNLGENIRYTKEFLVDITTSPLFPSPILY